MKASLIKETGNLVAAFLTGAWRLNPPRCDLHAADFETIAPLLLRTGSGALGWWRLRESDLQNSAAAAEFHQAYRLYTLEASLNKSKIETVFALLRSAGVESILIKGYAAARYYPEHSLRPYGDIDICVRKDDYRKRRAHAKGSGSDVQG